MLWLLPREDMASVEPAPSGTGPGGRKGDLAETKGQSAGWHSPLLQAEPSACRNELCSLGLEQTDYMS